MSSKVQKEHLLKATHTGVLKVKNAEIACYVLEDGERVISGRGIQNALGYPQNASGQALSKEVLKLNDRGIIEAITNRIEFKRPGAGGSAVNTYGYRAEVLVDICDLLLEYRKHNKLTPAQTRLATQAEILTRAFAKVGVIALIDEATGYQKAKNEYQKILELYIAKEIRPWIMTFDDNFYIQLYRLLGWTWDAYKMKKKQHPQYVGKLTNRLIYEKLAPGVLQELQRVNPKTGKGNRKTKHHQLLTENVGYRELLKLISAVTILMEQFPDGDLTGAIQKIDARFPSFSPFYQTGMDFPVVADKQVFDNVIKQASKPVQE
ncbi:MAG TPA: P63C domain-containing protein [Clostridia bacterium]